MLWKHLPDPALQAKRVEEAVGYGSLIGCRCEARAFAGCVQKQRCKSRRQKKELVQVLQCSQGWWPVAEQLGEAQQ